MSSPLSNDVRILLRGLQLVSKEACKIQEVQCKEIWQNSNVKALASECYKDFTQSCGDSSSFQEKVSKTASESFQRSRMVFEGLKVFSQFNPGLDSNLSPSVHPPVDAAPLRVPSELTPPPQTPRVPQSTSTEDSAQPPPRENVSAPTATSTPRQQSTAARDNSAPATQNIKTKPKVKQTLSDSAKQRAVPASRISRLISFGSLAAGLGVGTVAEASRRALGLKNTTSVGSALDASSFLSEANAERIVNTLCKVRGAALKIGQILSIQDNNIISPQLQKAFERVRQSADFMPLWQVEKVMSAELGSDWRSKMSSFEPKPFAAASIGQVHLATLHDGTEVAMKIQYPGVAQGIESDIENLVSVMKVWNIFPEGLFIDKLVEVAKRELSWEVDYKREAECTKKFKQLVAPYPEYVVPTVIDELCTQQIFTSQLIEGVPVDQCVNLDQTTRNNICLSIMKLCLKELFEFRYMQTDPNWSNFFYDPETQRLGLLDFGATRSYEKPFMDMYIQVIKSAADGDRDGVLHMSRAMGFLTGYESKIMEQAHVDTVMILAEVFRYDRPFNFGRQDTTRRVQSQVPTMINHRLCPPPEQIYSLHRKLSGVFLLCSKLQASISCRPLLEDVWSSYRFGDLPHPHST